MCAFITCRGGKEAQYGSVFVQAFPGAIVRVCAVCVGVWVYMCECGCVCAHVCACACTCACAWCGKKWGGTDTRICARYSSHETTDSFLIA